MAKKKWIQSIKMKKGALTQQAKRAGKSVAEFAATFKGSDTRTKRRINLYRTLLKLRKKGVRKGAR